MTVLYLDSAATTPVRREVLEAMWPYLTQEFGNASSHHEAGQRCMVANADSHSRPSKKAIRPSIKSTIFLMSATLSERL